MRYFTYVEPTSVDDPTPLFVTMSEEQILDSYWEYWSEKMLESGRITEDINPRNCIDDWRVIHWAVETTP